MVGYESELMCGVGGGVMVGWEWGMSVGYCVHDHVSHSVQYNECHFYCISSLNLTTQ